MEICFTVQLIILITHFNWTMRVLLTTGFRYRVWHQSETFFTADYNEDGLVDLQYRMSVGGERYLFMRSYDPVSAEFGGAINLGPSHNNLYWWQVDLNDDNIPDAVSSEGYQLSIGNSGYLYR